MPNPKMKSGGGIVDKRLNLEITIHKYFRYGEHSSDTARQVPRSRSSGVTRVFVEQQEALKIFISRFIRSPQDIDDIAQETFARAFSAEQKSEINHIKAYLFRIARNTALEVLSNKSARLTSFIDDACDDSILKSNENVEETVDVAQRFDQIKAAIAALPPQCQRVFIMHKVYGFKYREISRELNISISTVEKHIITGLKKCREFVKAQEEGKPDAVVEVFSEKAGRRK